MSNIVRLASEHCDRETREFLVEAMRKVLAKAKRDNPGAEGWNLIDDVESEIAELLVTIHPKG